MADEKLTSAEIPSLGALTTDDLLYVVDDPSGTPISKSLAVSVLDARYLLEANNLSDLPNAATARTNLGVAIGSNVQAYDATLAAWAAFNTNGILTQTAADTFTGRTITGTANQISVSNGDGVSGNPTLSTPQDIHTSASPTFVSVTLTGTIEIPTTTNTVGQIIQNSVRVFHTYGTASIFVGPSAGNFTLTGGYNTGIGGLSLTALTSGAYNLGIAYNAGGALTSGDNNIAIGANALATAETSDNNLAIGFSALTSATTGYSNVGVGTNSLYNLTEGFGCIGIGVSALNANTVGTENTAIGALSLSNVVDGDYNLGIGSNALRWTTSSWNVGIGIDAGLYSVGGGFNVYIGGEAGKGTSAQTRWQNTVIGVSAGKLLSSASGNLLLGYAAGDVITTGDNNIIIGYDIDPSGAGASNELNIGGVYKGDVSAVTAEIPGTLTIPVATADKEALVLQTTDDNATKNLLETRASDATPSTVLNAVGNLELPTTTSAIGIIEQNGSPFIHSYGTNNIFVQGAGNFTLTGADNIGIGTTALDSLTDGRRNLAIGRGALTTLTGGDYNVALGMYSLYWNTGSQNVAVGFEALKDNVGGSFNFGLGYQAVQNNVGGNYNVGIGSNALNDNISGNNCMAIGTNALRLNTGNDNIGIGYRAGQNNAAGANNVNIGSWAGYGNGGGDHSSCVFIGLRAGYEITTGDNNTCIGYQAGDVLTTGDDNIIIGYDIDPSGAGVSDELNIGGLIKGYLAAHASGPAINLMGGTPQAQQAHIVDADGNLADITTKFNTLLADLEGYGLLAAA